MHFYFLTPSHRGDSVWDYPSCKYLLDRDKIMESDGKSGSSWFTSTGLQEKRKGEMDQRNGSINQLTLAWSNLERTRREAVGRLDVFLSSW